jgi:hypothetical protein
MKRTGVNFEKFAYNTTENTRSFILLEFKHGFLLEGSYLFAVRVYEELAPAAEAEYRKLHSSLNIILHQTDHLYKSHQIEHLRQCHSHSNPELGLWEQPIIHKLRQFGNDLDPELLLTTVAYQQYLQKYGF